MRTDRKIPQGMRNGYVSMSVRCTPGNTMGGDRTGTDVRAHARKKPVLCGFVVIFSFFVALGFPGNFTGIFGEKSDLLFGYIAFFLQIGTMLFTSGQTIWDAKPVNLKKRYLPCYLLLLVFFTVSMIATVNVKDQLVSCIRFSVTALFGLWIAERYDTDDITEMLYRAQWMFVIATLVFLVLSPGTAFSRQNNNELSFTGLFTVKNSCALELCWGILCQFCMLIRNAEGKKRRVTMPFIVLLAVQMVLMVLCRATGAVFCLLVPVLYVLFRRTRIENGERLPIGFLYTALSVGFIFSALSLLSLMSPFLESIGKDATLTGRTVMWEKIIEMMMSGHTLTGFGFSMFWRNEGAIAVLHSMFRRDSWYSTMMYGSHNMVLELWLDVGLVGLASYFIMIMASFRNVRRMPVKPYIFCTVYLTGFMFMGLTERLYTTNNFQTLFLFLICGTGCLWAERTGKEQTAQRKRKGEILPRKGTEKHGF